MKNKTLLLVITTLLMQNTFSQTLVNLAWKDTIGHPTIMNNYFSGVSDISNGMVYMIGNIYVTGEQENFLVGKIDVADGNLVWLKEFNSQSSNRDFGLDVQAKGDYVYVTGLSWDSINSRSRITTLKLDAANGDTVWTASYANAYNGYHAAADITVDDTGNVFISGTEQTGTLNFGMVVLKYDSNGNQLWAGEYDSTMMYDAAVAMLLDPGKNLAVTGFSGNGFGSWDFVTVGFDPQTGAQQAYARYGNGAGNFSQPVGIARRMDDETYIAGTAAFGGHTYIKLIAYDSLMNQIYVKPWGDSTLNQEAVTMEDDLNGSLFIGGTQTKANGGKDMVLLRYEKATGNLIWAKTISANDPTKEASAKDIANDGYGGCYITGKMHNGSDFDIATAYINPDGNLEWLKTFSRGSNTNDQPDGIAYDDNGGVIVTATSMGSDTVYLAVKYEQFETPNEIVYDTASKPLYKDKELIVRFNPSLLNPHFVNNKELQFADITQVLQDSIIDSLSAKVGFSMGKAKIGKIFKQLSVADSLSITRYGDTIVSPKFWASMMLYLPDEAPDSLLVIQDSLNSIRKYVYFAAKNFYSKSFCTTNDPNMPPAIYSTSVSDINVCGAWGIEKGNSAIRVGIYDKGIKWNHQDFTYGASSKAQAGFNFTNGTNDVVFDPNNDNADHGTGVAGLAAALSNNFAGIPGVAGGDMSSYPTYYNTGASLYNMKFYFWSELYEALVMGATSTPDLATGYGLHIINMSNGVLEPLITLNDLKPIVDAIRWDFGNGVVTIASAGNNETGQNEKSYPASIPQDNMIIDVAGSTFNGTGNTAFSSSTFVDITAPSEQTELFFPSTFNSSAIITGGGTSYSAPLVTGAAALLLSHVDLNSIANLTHEDVEKILTIYARHNLSSFGFGEGPLDATNALSHVEYPEYQVQHFQAYVSQSSVSSINYFQKFYMYNDYETVPSSTLIEGHENYYADIYEISVTNFHTLFGTAPTILHSWPLNAMSNCLGYTPPVGSGNLATLDKSETDIKLTNVSQSSADLKGYVYHIVMDNSGTPMDTWIPFDITHGTGILSYAVHTHDAAFSKVSDLTKEINSINLIPNPTSNSTSLVLNLEKGITGEIKVTDIMGKLVSVSTHKFDTGVSSVDLGVSNLSKGMYFVSVQGESALFTTKLIIN